MYRVSVHERPNEQAAAESPSAKNTLAHVKIPGYPYKRFFDLVILFVSHLVLLPIWLVLWVIIPLSIWFQDRGPIFYRQTRVGKNGKLFQILKFRTMKMDADVHAIWTSNGDIRVTWIGQFLRPRALDELPQIINVLKGDMSLVGPRALNVDEQRGLENKIPGFSERLRLEPGITGLAQVYDHMDDGHTKLHYDLEYIQRLSPWLDLKLISQSAWNTLVGRWDRRAGKTDQQNGSSS